MSTATVERPGAGKRRRAFTLTRTQNIALTIGFIGFAIILPFFFAQGGDVMNNLVLGAAYVVMALGLNIIVGYAGLLDLGYVAFFAIGAYMMGYFGSGFWDSVGKGGNGVHVFVTGQADKLPGFHFNFLLILVIAVVATTIAGMLIGLPTLRLRGDYIAIVTLGFGEIIGRIAINGDDLPVLGKVTAGRQGITPVDKIDLPGIEPFQTLNLRPWYWFALGMVVLVLFVNFRLRDSRLGRAWIALREDEVAAASMGVPLVRTKLAAYGTGAAFGGMSGAFLASYLNTVNADQFQFSFSILILSMIILGGLGSIWGCVLGGIVLSAINNYFIPEVFNNVPAKLGLDFDLTEVSAGIFGFLLVFMMVLRPEGLLPERRRQLELEEGVGSNEAIYEARMP